MKKIIPLILLFFVIDFHIVSAQNIAIENTFQKTLQEKFFANSLISNPEKIPVSLPSDFISADQVKNITLIATGGIVTSENFFKNDDSAKNRNKSLSPFEVTDKDSFLQNSAIKKFEVKSILDDMNSLRSLQ